ncbi:MAG: type II toxin-antitoxin system VapC family toxin [Acidobacteriota bacterium]
MALYYFDSSAIVKLYLDEPGTEQVIRLASSTSGNQIATSVLTRVEIRSAISRKARRNEIEVADAGQAVELLEEHWKTRFVRQPVSDSILDQACLLLDRHGLRAYDGIQLASCLALNRTVSSGSGSVVFVCSDTHLSDAAAAEGLVCLDPEESADE